MLITWSLVAKKYSEPMIFAVLSASALMRLYLKKLPMVLL